MWVLPNLNVVQKEIKIKTLIAFNIEKTRNVFENKNNFDEYLANVTKLNSTPAF